MTLGLLFNQKVKGLSDKNLRISTDEGADGKRLGLEVEPLGIGRYTNAYKVTVSLDAPSKKLYLRLVNPDQVLNENNETPVDNILEQLISSATDKRLVTDDTLVLEVAEDNKSVYYSNKNNEERAKDLSNLVEDQKGLILEILELEPNSRFAHSQLINLIHGYEETYANTKEAFAKRLELNDKIVKSSENLLNKNKGQANRFSYFLRLYQLK